ncbi:hypothetical protein LUZ60_009517 [Juncus effusus]|nr:hypothetical protein LUZ60_009517 [Juncus effusus]
MMNMQKIVLKVPIYCDKCKTCIMKTIAKIDGIKSIAIDVEKSTLTLICDSDLVQIVKELKKAGKVAQVVSVGPEKEEKKDEKKDDKKKDEKKDYCKPLPPCCTACRPSYVVIYDEHPYGGCVIS